ncbi:hypothetical protein K9U39_11700 [Rhodoblastus acidophilus]|uniref:Uncharacterized protein n=1 Tax=Candidatus Rhodoblastus alkanivorans TaxID=2954117 RepID=A0ABS9Z9X9_9HYPH|nr:hypothetical protein [Candidatus Rhodoblastus alkanivorans]MCI4679805.1 hypothetical protein [Candidatus Rhodoblastus alkanivorans]MCI4684275.1 hypothetical protein [Candidatus Rhodoblastus alkanivorans]MDI4641595.1 hypothetical protein [Rhodoblastus acidophilus]
MCKLQDDLELATGHIAWLKSVIVDWRTIVADLRRAGHRTENAESTLQTFIRTLKTLESYEIFLLGEIEE